MVRQRYTANLPIDPRDVALARGSALLDARTALLDIMMATSIEEARKIAKAAIIETRCK